jgi:hypothetical protein
MIMPPFVISARINNPRFKVTFDEGAVCYCNSVKSLASILGEHGMTVSVRRLHAIVGPDDRRRQSQTPMRREFSFEGVHITRIQYARGRPRPTHRTSNVFDEPVQDDEPPFLHAYFDHVRAGNGVISPHLPAYLEHLAREWRMNHARISRTSTPVPPRFTFPPQQRERNLIIMRHYVPTPAHAGPPLGLFLGCGRLPELGPSLSSHFISFKLFNNDTKSFEDYIDIGHHKPGR